VTVRVDDGVAQWALPVTLPVLSFSVRTRVPHHVGEDVL
jgi:hypothetical protein